MLQESCEDLYLRLDVKVGAFSRVEAKVAVVGENGWGDQGERGYFMGVADFTPTNLDE